MAGDVAGPGFDSYRWRGGCEAMLRIGRDDGPVVVALPPLFEEANRTRTFLVGLLRRLAARGVGGVLPDLPGTGESLVATEHARIADMRAAAAELAAGLAQKRRVHLLGVRSGALLGDDARVESRWYLAPQDGAGLLRDLERIAAAERGLSSDPGPFGHGPVEASQVEWILVAGHRIAPALLAELTNAGNDASGAAPTRTVRLDTDRRAADRHVAGAPPWRRSEPEDDPALADLLADDLAQWIAACGG